VVGLVIIVLVLCCSTTKYSGGGQYAKVYATGRAVAFFVVRSSRRWSGFAACGWRPRATFAWRRRPGRFRPGADARLPLSEGGHHLGMLTDGLGLLGGTMIFITYGEHAYEALLGFGFGGTLLALFMRVGGGIYTRPRTSGRTWWARSRRTFRGRPRNAATIAGQRGGDNVGD